MIRSSDIQSPTSADSALRSETRPAWLHALVDGWKDPIACGVLVFLVVLLVIVSWESSGPRHRPGPQLSIKPESGQDGRRG